MLNKINWKAFSDKNQHLILDQIKRTISDCNGSIIHFNLFSDLAISLTIEIEEKNINQLHQSLDNLISISELKSSDFNSESNKEWIIFFNISFSSGKGELKREVLSVPG